MSNLTQRALYISFKVPTISLFTTIADTHKYVVFPRKSDQSKTLLEFQFSIYDYPSNQ